MGTLDTMVGTLLFAVGLLSLAVGAVFYRRMRALAVAPVLRTGYVARAPADGSGKVAAEGRVIADSAIRAPCSGQTCLAYEITLDREWEREVDGVPSGKQKGSTRVSTARGGAIFQIDDGSGPAIIDAREEVAADLAQSHLERFPIGATVPGEIRFGEMRVQTPSDLGLERTTAFTATEKILLPQAELFACGALVNGTIGKPSTGPLVLSRSGHVAQVASAKRKALAFLGAGALLAAGATALLLAHG